MPPRGELGQPFRQIPGSFTGAVQAGILIDIVQHHVSLVGHGEEQPPGGVCQRLVGRAPTAEPGGEVGQRHPAQEVQIDAGIFGPQRGLKFCGRGLFRRGASGQRIGERVCKAAEQPLHALLIVLNAGAPVRTGDHSADRTHRRPFAPDRHGLGGLRLLPARQDGEDRREPALADGGAVHVKLRAPHQVKGRNGQQDDEQTFPPLCQTALSFLRHGRPPTGSSMRTVSPGPDRSTSLMVPSCRSTISFAMESPRPVPPDSRERALSTR